MSIIKKQFKINGMHCSSCAMNIDFDLEDLEGVKKVSTNYATQLTTIEYDETKLTLNEITNQIQKTGYKAIIHTK